MPSNALYKSRTWITRRYSVDRKSPEEIAKECGTTVMTIYRYLNKFELIKKR